MAELALEALRSMPSGALLVTALGWVLLVVVVAARVAFGKDGDEP